ncbi:IS701 family transposase [Streptomyces sp. NPDC002889]|uniref:IS701 family transposase n=1 Tax=Streptomyces sp. NPDC002889 TaxID=3364669 RepID=UPI0036843D6C
MSTRVTGHRTARSSDARQARGAVRGQPGSTRAVTREDFLAALFSSLSRRDQRERGEQYVRGLLVAQGRKSVRNIAASLGIPEEEQRLHHFIAVSTWDWEPVRAALADFLERTSPPQAWVIQSMLIPKVGEHTVGVDRWFDQRYGQTVVGQRAYGAWYASDRLSVPVNWKLFLPSRWAYDRDLRNRAEIPDKVAGQPLEECAATVVLDAAAAWNTRPRPVLMDLRDSNGWRAMSRFASAGFPVLARIDRGARLVVEDPLLPGAGGAAMPAARILDAVKALRHPVEWADPSGAPSIRASLVASVRVRTPESSPGARRTLLLLGEWHTPDRAPAQVWITDLTKVPSSSLLRLTKLTRRVARDFSRGGDEVGLRDFVGRSFRGWHRHMTLASAAHTMAALPL